MRSKQELLTDAENVLRQVAKAYAAGVLTGSAREESLFQLLARQADVYATAKHRFLDNMPNPNEYFDREELAAQLKSMKHRYSNREGYTSHFISGYQQGLAI